MKAERSYRGWIAATIIAALMATSLFVAERYFRQPSEDFLTLAQQVRVEPPSEKGQGILLQIDTELIATNPVSINASSEIARRSDAGSDSVGLMRRPPELASSVVLREPLSSNEFVSLPLTQRASSFDALMLSMDKALASPVAVVSSKTVVSEELAGDLISQRFDNLRSPSEIIGKIPSPSQLMAELEALRGGGRRSKTAEADDLSSTEQPQLPRYISTTPLSADQVQQIYAWIAEVERKVNQLVQGVGLENPDCQPLLKELEALSEQGRLIGEQLVDHEWAASIIRTSYSLQRRVAVWSAVQASLDGMTIALSAPKQGDQVSKVKVAESLADLEKFLATVGDNAGWKKYLLIEDLKKWTSASSEQWKAGNQLARNFLSRVYWARLDGRQKELLQHETVTRLADNLATWGRDPVDYRHLLVSLEQIEQNSLTRVAYTVADTVQTLRLAESKSQKQLAEVLNTHYRNANLRLTVSKSLIERFLPEGQYEVRPVRKKILGADTNGDSAIKTKLAVKFHPDPHGWNVELGVHGDLVSSTQSSKGPAVFHNTAVAEIDSHRYLKMNPNGFNVSSQPAQVNSTDQLQRMNTDFDGLPVVGDFVRLVVREQFNQNRGLARRISERMIAKETDAEIDRKLQENLEKAERQFTARILGPLQRLTLDPLVVSMSTTEDRLAIRYRLAGESQLSAHTPRPRAPSESLTSFQVHQSVLNNTIDNIGLTGKDWQLKDLYRSLGEVFAARWTPSEDIPDDITIRFADHRPITVEMANGKLRLQLRIARFHREEGIDAHNFVVTATYTPVADGLKASLTLDPDSAIEIQTKHLPVKDRLALRLIFSKVFVSQPELPLISEQWIEDGRAKSLAVSQLEIRDGWLAVAISDANSELAAEVAERSRNVKNVR